MIASNRLALCALLGLTAACASTTPMMTTVRPTPERQVVADLDELTSSGMILTVGEPQFGELTVEDHLWDSDDSYLQAWEFRPEAGRTVSVDLASTDFDSFLWVVGPGMEDNNDDGAGFCDSRITFTPRSGGMYRVVVNTLGSRSTGSFSLTASYDPAPPDPRFCDLEAADPWSMQQEGDTFADMLALIMAPTSVEGVLELGSDASGTLTENDEFTNENKFLQLWELEGSAGQTVAVELSSTDFDTSVWFVGHGLELFDDDGGGNCNSTIIAVLPRDGTYRIGVTSFVEYTTGDYRLGIASEPGDMRPGGCGGGDSFDGFAGAPPAEINMLQPVGTVRVGADELGMLTDDDDLGRGSILQVWELEANAGDEAFVELVSTDFDTYLWMTGNGMELADDDGGGNCNSTLRVTFSEGGTYRIGAGSYAGMDTGRYRLRVAAERSAVEPGACGSADDGGLGVDNPFSDDEMEALSSTARPIEVGDRIGGELTDTDVPLSASGYGQGWTLIAAPGTALRIDLISEDFDPLLFAFGPEFGAEADDDGGEGLNSLLETVMPDDGILTLVVTTFSAGETGFFTLRVRAQ